MLHATADISTTVCNVAFSKLSRRDQSVVYFGTDGTKY